MCLWCKNKCSVIVFAKSGGNGVETIDSIEKMKSCKVINV